MLDCLIPALYSGQLTGAKPIQVQFVGSAAGAETLARAMTLIESAKMNGLDPQGYIADLLNRIHDHKINRIEELLPWKWVPLDAPQAIAA